MADLHFTVTDAAPYEAPGAVFDLASRKLHEIAGRELAPISGFDVLLVPQTDEGYRLILLTPRRLTEEEEKRVSKFIDQAFREAVREWREIESKKKKANQAPEPTAPSGRGSS